MAIQIKRHLVQYGVTLRGNAGMRGFDGNLESQLAHSKNQPAVRIPLSSANYSSIFKEKLTSGDSPFDKDLRTDS
jgi:hypothetical protein